MTEKGENTKLDAPDNLALATAQTHSNLTDPNLPPNTEVTPAKYRFVTAPGSVAHHFDPAVQASQRQSLS
jgi:hypothetical protein